MRLIEPKKTIQTTTRPDVGRRRQTQAVLITMLLAVGGARSPAHAVDSSPAATTSMPVTVVRPRPDLGALKNVVARRDGGSLNVSGDILVDAPRRARPIKTNPARIKVEIIGPTGEVITSQARTLGPHGIHVEGSRRPTFDLHFDVSTDNAKEVRVTLEPDTH